MIEKITRYRAGLSSVQKNPRTLLLYFTLRSFRTRFRSSSRWRHTSTMRVRGDGRLEISRSSAPGASGSEPTGATVADTGKADYPPVPDISGRDGRGRAGWAAEAGAADTLVRVAALHQPERSHGVPGGTASRLRQLDVPAALGGAVGEVGGRRRSSEAATAEPVVTDVEDHPGRK